MSVREAWSHVHSPNAILSLLGTTSSCQYVSSAKNYEIIGLVLQAFFNKLGGVIYCAVPENIHTPQQKVVFVFNPPPPPHPTFTLYFLKMISHVKTV